MNVEAAQEMGVHVGSIIRIPFYTDAQNQSSKPLGKPFLLVNVKLVGEVEASTDVVQSDISRLNSAEVIFSPALTREFSVKCATGTEQWLQIQGGAKNAKRVLAEAYKVDPVAAHLPAEITAILPSYGPAGHLTRGHSVGRLWRHRVAGRSVDHGLIVGRLLRTGADELEILRALGASRTMLLGDELMGVMALAGIRHGAGGRRCGGTFTT